LRVCGIAGIVGAGRPDIGALERMASAMVHRGPDGLGVWGDEELGFAFRRLAIIDLDERSNQPLHLGRLHLVFNGEIYNYLELHDELGDRGHRFVTEGDAEVLLHAWAEWDEGALDRLNGMFAFGIWDDERHRLTFAVDPFAEKPLLYCSIAGRLLFASDVRALQAVDPAIGVADEDAIRAFVSLSTMPVLPRTFFSDIYRLPGAHLARWERGRLAVRRYWRPRMVAVPPDPALAAERLRELLNDSVRLRLRSDVPVGTSLSGGVDSSGIVGISSRQAGAHVRHAFTASFPGFERDEWCYAEEVARAADVTTHHRVCPTIDELFEDLELLVGDQQEPFVSTSIYAQWRVMRAAREAGVIVLLDGQGGDELFGGYAGIAGWALRSAGPRAALSALAEDRGVAGDLAIAYAVGRTPRALVRRHRMRYASPYVARGIAREAAGVNRLPPDWKHTGSPLRRELLVQAFRTSLPNLCRYGDRNSMAHSVEMRMPFLDRRVADFALSLPPSLVFKGGVTKRLLRDALRGVVPDAVLDRREKVGYETPERSWFNDPAARGRIAQVVLDPGARKSGRYDTAALERDFAAGSWSDVGALWRVVNVELWLRSISPVGCVACTA
jgi:asparagine synthase (glutamine-hydrolysing)